MFPGRDRQGAGARGERTGWLPTCHMNLYELFALKRIDRHDERVQSTAKGCPGILVLDWLGSDRFGSDRFGCIFWTLEPPPPSPSTDLVEPGHCSSARPGTSTRQITLPCCCDAKLKIQVEVAEWLTWQHASHLHLPVPVAIPVHSKKSLGKPLLMPS